MTSIAALSLYRQVLKDERPFLFAMTLVADLVLFGAGAQLSRQRSAVRVVAVIALDQPLLNKVPEGTSEFCSHFSMAAIAEQRLFFDEQRPLRFGFVWRVATGAAYVVR